MRDGFGIPRDQVIIKAEKRDVAAGTLGVAAAGTAAGSGYVAGKHGRQALIERGNAVRGFSETKKDIRRGVRARALDYQEIEAERTKGLFEAKGNGSLRRMVNSNAEGHKAQVESVSQKYRAVNRAALKASGKAAKAAKSNAKTAAIAGGAGLAGTAALATAAHFTGKKEKVVKDAFGISKADKPFEETNSNFRSKGEAKAMITNPAYAIPAAGGLAAAGTVIHAGATAGGKEDDAYSKASRKSLRSNKKPGNYKAAIKAGNKAARVSRMRSLKIQGGALAAEGALIGGAMVAGHKSANKWREKQGLAPRDGWTGKPKEKVMKDAFGIDRDEVEKAYNPLKQFKQARQIKRGLKLAGTNRQGAMVSGASQRTGTPVGPVQMKNEIAARSGGSAITPALQRSRRASLAEAPRGSGWAPQNRKYPATDRAIAYQGAGQRSQNAARMASIRSRGN
jgi:hypothetical protein